MRNFVTTLPPYSTPSACGIWQRVSYDVTILKSNGYEIEILSSNIVKGTGKKSSNFGHYKGIPIHRFKVFLKLGGTSMFWFPFFKLLKERPKIIHTHGYRHPHSIQALLAGKLTGSKVILTTHGPFNKDKRRPLYLKVIDSLYDILIGWWELKLYDRIIRISDWELPYLKKLGASNKKTLLMPNGINDEIFIEEKDLVKKKIAGNRISFIGRVDPVKRVEWVTAAAEKLPEKNFEILGPLQGYESFSSDLENVTIRLESYDKEMMKELLDRTDIYLFPSIRESFGMTALEAMARGCIVIASNTLGVREYLVDGENGFIVNSREEMSEKIKFLYENWDQMDEIRKNGYRTAERYKQSEVGKKLLILYKELM